MNPVNQTRFGNGSGNCFAACVASILEIPIEEIDPLILPANGSNWIDGLQSYLSERGMFLLHVSIRDQYPLGPVPETLVIAIGPNNRRGGRHAVVCEFQDTNRLVLVHDPGSDEITLARVDEIWFIARLMR
jgi:hypothetical protein